MQHSGEKESEKYSVGEISNVVLRSSVAAGSIIPVGRTLQQIQHTESVELYPVIDMVIYATVVAGYKNKRSLIGRATFFVYYI